MVSTSVWWFSAGFVFPQLMFMLLFSYLRSKKSIKSVFWRIYCTIYEEKDPTIHFFESFNNPGNGEKTEAEEVNTDDRAPANPVGPDVNSDGKSTKSSDMNANNCHRLQAVTDLNSSPCHFVLINNVSSLMKYNSSVQVADLWNSVCNELELFLNI